jgi:hypothetical protein
VIATHMPLCRFQIDMPDSRQNWGSTPCGPPGCAGPAKVTIKTNAFVVVLCGGAFERAHGPGNSMNRAGADAKLLCCC